MKILFVAGQFAYGEPRRGEGYEFVNMLPALRAAGHSVVHFESFDRRAHEDFAMLNRAFVQAVEREKPDVIFCVLMGYELWTETLDLVAAASGATIINWGTDDSWKYRQFARFIAPHVHCYATTSRMALEVARKDGHANFVLTQWAANDATLAHPKKAKDCSHKVTFTGAAYGNRRKWVAGLLERGIQVDCYGHGWPNGPIPASEIPRIANDSVITLNFGDSGIHWRGAIPYRSRQVKARVFEVTGAGGFLMTQPADEFADFFVVGEEVATFDSPDELVERIDFYLRNPGERDRVAEAGHQRTRRDHTYVVRLGKLLDDAALARGSKAASIGDPSLVAQRVEALQAVHKPGVLLRWVRALLVGLLRIPFRERAERAARRLVFEISWRCVGEKTFRVSGWPGRMFYRES